MAVNHEKSQVIHALNHQQPRCQKDLVVCDRELQYTSNYKYLGCWINDFANHEKTVEALTAAESQSFGRIVNVFKRMGDMGYETYTTLYENYFLPVADYAAGVWGFKMFQAPQILQNWIQKFFLGVHRFAPVPAMWTEMDWQPMQYVGWILYACQID